MKRSPKDQDTRWRVQGQTRVLFSPRWGSREGAERLLAPGTGSCCSSSGTGICGPGACLAVPCPSSHPSSMNWLPKTVVWAGIGECEPMWSWAAESISESIPVLFPSLLKCFPCALSTLSCTLSLIFCFICGPQLNKKNLTSFTNQN